jgi:hypothetical protein
MAARDRRREGAGASTPAAAKGTRARRAGLVHGGTSYEVNHTTDDFVTKRTKISGPLDLVEGDRVGGEVVELGGARALMPRDRLRARAYRRS